MVQGLVSERRRFVGTGLDVLRLALKGSYLVLYFLSDIARLQVQPCSSTGRLIRRPASAKSDHTRQTPCQCKV